MKNNIFLLLMNSNNFVNNYSYNAQYLDENLHFHELSKLSKHIDINKII